MAPCVGNQQCRDLAEAVVGVLLVPYLAGIVAVFMISMDNLVVTNALPVIRQACTPALKAWSGRSTATR